jgi:hypothetical protein
MASAIGIRVYRISVHQQSTKKIIPLDSSKLNIATSDYITEYIASHSSVTQNTQLERSWYFEQKKDNKGSSRGYVHYGTFGFESNFVDPKTKKRNYRRKITDIEEIPLYFEFWCPKKETFGFAAFQSFQGRSCINLVMSKLKIDFDKKNPGFALSFRKLLPSDAKGGLYAASPVKKLRLLKRNASSDISDKYFGKTSPDSIDFEITMSARRNKSLGNIGSLLKSLNGGSKNVIMHAGIEFPEAVAEIRVGDRTRRVGVLGWNSDAGVIDITDDIDRGPDGHPTFDSMKRETNDSLKDFYHTMQGDAW